jgi:hypothetical protein
MDETTTGGGDWSSWVQGVLGGVVDKAATSQWVQPYETERMKLQALGNMGYGYYTEGQRQALVQPGTFAGINTGVLLLIGGVVAVAMLLKK